MQCSARVHGIVYTQTLYCYTVTLFPGRCFRSSEGWGIGFYYNRQDEPFFSIFPGSLGQKGSDWFLGLCTRLRCFDSRAESR